MKVSHVCGFFYLVKPLVPDLYFVLIIGFPFAEGCQELGNGESLIAMPAHACKHKEQGQNQDYRQYYDDNQDIESLHGIVELCSPCLQLPVLPCPFLQVKVYVAVYVAVAFIVDSRINET